MEFGMVYLLHHFHKNWWYRQVRTGLQLRHRKVIRASSDYILGTYLSRFEMVGIRGVKNHPPYHLVLSSRLLICPNKAVHQY